MAIELKREFLRGIGSSAEGGLSRGSCSMCRFAAAWLWAGGFSGGSTSPPWSSTIGIPHPSYRERRDAVRAWRRGRAMAEPEL